MFSGSHEVVNIVNEPAVTVSAADVPVHNMQTNGRQQITANFNQIVQEIIPQLSNQVNTNTRNMLPSRPSNPFLNQGMTSTQGARHLRGQGHVRSFSQGYGYTYHNHGGLPFHPAQQHGHMFQSQNQPSSQLNSSFVLDLGDAGGTEPTPPHLQDSNNNGGQRPATTDPMANLRTLWKASEGSVPFILLLMAKVLYSHRLGILVLIGMFGTFYHANSSLKKQIAQRELHTVLDSLGNLCWIIVFLSANIFFVYYVFEEQVLYKSLFLRVPHVGEIDMWNMLWVVGVTDFIIKYATIIVKAVVALLPRQLLQFKKKGKYYLVVEVVSQLYRSVVPLVPWLFFLQGGDYGGQWFSMFLTALYLICKCNHLYVKLKEVRNGLLKFKVDVSYGCVPSQDQLQACDNSCPICQDKFTDPVMLSCTHIFCEDCVSMWFDRERTCPMCRAQIVDNPIWRDGTTASNIQLY